MAAGEAKTAFEAGNYELAASLFSEAINDEPSEDLLRLRSACFIHLQKFKEAKEDVDRTTDPHCKALAHFYYEQHQEAFDPGLSPHTSPKKGGVPGKPMSIWATFEKAPPLPEMPNIEETELQRHNFGP